MRSEQAPASVAAADPTPGAGERPVDRMAVLVAHGMGQQPEHETIDLVLDGLYRAAAEAGAPLKDPVVENACIEGKVYRRARVEIPLASGFRELHVYEAYWAPITEGNVTLRDTMSFLVRGGLNGVANATGPFVRWVFKKRRSYAERPAFGLWLAMTCAFLASFVAMHFAALAAVFDAVPVPDALVNDATLALVAIISLSLLIGMRILLSRRLRARTVSRRPSAQELRDRLVARVVGMRTFGLFVALSVAFLLALGVLAVLHVGAFGPVTRTTRLHALALALLAGATIHAAVRWLPLIGRARALAADKEREDREEWDALAKRLPASYVVLGGAVAVGVMDALLLRLSAQTAWYGTAIAVTTAAFLTAARLFLWRTPRDPDTPAEQQRREVDLALPLVLCAAVAAFVVGPDLVAGLGTAWQVAAAVCAGAVPAVLAPVLSGALVRKGIDRNHEAFVGTKPRGALGHTAVVALAAVAIGALAFAGVRASGGRDLRPVVVVAWGIIIAASFGIRHFLVQYVGDVAAYVSAHKLDRFANLRREIKAAVLERARAVYVHEIDEEPAYSRVAIVGHSLGSVVAYDALNALLLEERMGASTRVKERTSLLLTFGSPLDKTALSFALQNQRTSPTRDALGALPQPLILEEAFRQRLSWINVWATADVISDPLQFYDRPRVDPMDPVAVHNVEDLEATTPLAAHTEYWGNRLVWEILHEHVRARWTSRAADP